MKSELLLDVLVRGRDHLHTVLITFSLTSSRRAVKDTFSECWVETWVERQAPFLNSEKYKD